MADETQAGFVAVLGAPNVGKSTLVNRMVGTKITIVSPRSQTTRSQIRGICVIDKVQIVFVDTPGIFLAKQRLERAMVHAAWTGASNADAILLLIDANRGITSESRNIIERLQQLERPTIVALNKIDKVPRTKLLPLANEIREHDMKAGIFMISALEGDGTDDLLRTLLDHMPVGPWFYPKDQLTDVTERILAAEITREQLFLQLREELPYSATVETESWQQMNDGSIHVKQVIYLLRSSHKQIVLGRKGQQIRSIGTAARTELARILGCTVHLFLFVKVRERWFEDVERYRDIGLKYDV